VSVSPAAPITSWQRKFARAQDHLYALTTLVVGFLATEPYAAVEEVEDKDGGRVITHRGVIREKPPADWSPVVGDCLNNLRASLDHLVWGLAGERGNKTAFPLFSNPDRYCALTTANHLKFVSAKARARIELLQPYLHPDGPKAHPLGLLDRLTNDDKHRELLATEVGVAHVHVHDPIGQPAAGDALTFEFEPVDRLFENGAVLVRYFTSNPDVYVPIEFTFDVVLDPEGPAAGGPLLMNLVRLSYAVCLVLQDFEERFFPGLVQTPAPLAERPIRLVLA
jgi:hypothetical protein